MIIVKKKYLLMSMIGLIPFVGYMVFVFRGALSILGVIFVVPSCLFLSIIILGFCLLHDKRTKNKTGPKNISLYLSYLFISALIIYFGIMAPYDMTFIRPGSQFAMLAFVFFPFYAGLAMAIGYLIGLVIEFAARIVSKTYRDEDTLRRKAFFAHLSKFKIVYIVIIIAIGGHILLAGAIPFLESKGILPSSDIHYAAQVGSIRQVKRFLNKGVDINAKEKDSYRNTPLHKAVRHDQQDMIEFLVANGADIDSEASIGETPLHSAARIGSNKTVTLLIKLGADVNAQDNNGNTPLREAARKGRFEVVEKLVNNGANVNLSNKGNQTPIFLSVWYGYKDVIELLLKNGAEVNFVDKKGRSPLSVAVAKKYKGIEKLLREQGAKE